jgi:hypothetical protein
VLYSFNCSIEYSRLAPFLRVDAALLVLHTSCPSLLSHSRHCGSPCFGKRCRAYRASLLHRGRSPRVVCISNCEDLLHDLSSSMRSALTLTYADQPDVMAEVAQLDSQDAIADFIDIQGATDEFIFVLDHHNALDNLDEPVEVVATRKYTVSQWLDRIRNKHLSILGASPNSPRAIVISSSREQSGSKRFNLFGGLVNVEKPDGMTEWNSWKAHFGAGLPEMDAEEEAKMVNQLLNV